MEATANKQLKWAWCQVELLVEIRLRRTLRTSAMMPNNWREIKKLASVYRYIVPLKQWEYLQSYLVEFWPHSITHLESLFSLADSIHTSQASSMLKERDAHIMQCCILTHNTTITLPEVKFCSPEETEAWPSHLSGMETKFGLQLSFWWLCSSRDQPFVENMPLGSGMTQKKLGLDWQRAIGY